MENNRCLDNNMANNKTYQDSKQWVKPLELDILNKGHKDQVKDLISQQGNNMDKMFKLLLKTQELSIEVNMNLNC